MDLSSHVVCEGSDVLGTGVVLIDETGDAYLAPNSPTPDPRQGGRTIPLRYNRFDRQWDGVWVTLAGRFTRGGVDISSVDRVDRPDFPSEVTVRVTNPNGTGWTRTSFLAAADFTDLHSTDDQIYGSGGRRDKDGTDTLVLDCLYIDESFADWLGCGHPGDIEVHSALIPRPI